jgi:hypothetical protein
MSQQLWSRTQEFPSWMGRSIILIKSLCSESRVSGATKLPIVTKKGVHFIPNSLNWKHRLFFGDCSPHDRPTSFSKLIHRYYFYCTFYSLFSCIMLVQLPLYNYKICFFWRLLSTNGKYIPHANLFTFL